jgi:hypothetical protein
LAASNGLDGDIECLTGLSQPLAAVVEVANGWTLKTAIGEFTQNRDDGFVSCQFAGAPSMPRAKQLCAERQERLSMRVSDDHRAACWGSNIEDAC